MALVRRRPAGQAAGAAVADPGRGGGRPCGPPCRGRDGRCRHAYIRVGARSPSSATPRPQKAATRWLSNWNEGWNALNLVGGHKRDGESFRDCCAREVAEELGLAPGVDFRVAALPEGRLEYVAESRRAGETTAYTQEVFAVDLLTDAARERVAADPDNAWLGEREVRAGRAADGRAVSPTVEFVLVRMGALSAARE